MSEVHGKTAAMYWMPTMTVTTIAFVDSDPDTITDSGNGFEDAGFKAGDLVTISGSTSNDGTYLIDTVAAGTLTLDAGASLTAEVAGDTVTAIVPLPGQVMVQFYGVELIMNDRLIDITHYEDAGVAEYLSGITDWLIRARAFWSTTDNQNAWLGAAEKTVRMFLRYDSDPTATTCWYWEGTGLTRIQGVNAANSDAVRRNIELQGTGSATFTTRTTAWPVVS